MKRFVSVVIVLAILVYGGIVAEADIDKAQFKTAYLDSMGYSVEQWHATPVKRASFAAYATLDMLIYLSNTQLGDIAEVIKETVDWSTRNGVVVVAYKTESRGVAVYLFANGHAVAIWYKPEDKTAMLTCIEDFPTDPRTILKDLRKYRDIDGYFIVSCDDYGYQLNNLMDYAKVPKDLHYIKHQLSEAGITIPIPRDYYVFKRGLPSNDPAYAQVGIPAAFMEAMLIEKNEYLNALSPDRKTQITVTMEPAEAPGVSLLSDEELLNMFIYNIPAIKAYGMDIKSYEIYHSGNISFIRYWGHKTKDMEGDLLSYTAFFEDHFVTINLFSEEDPISPDDEALMEYIITNSTILKSLSTPGPINTPTPKASQPTPKTTKAPLAEGVWICENCGRENSLNFCPRCGTAKPTPTPSPTPKPTPSPEPTPKQWKCNNCNHINTGRFCEMCGAKNASILYEGDLVFFGHYAGTSTGEQRYIWWIVLDVQGDNALLLSRYGIDVKTFSKVKKYVAWETSTLRLWLNENFLQRAFSKEEQNAIQLTTVSNDMKECFSEWIIEDGKNTKDKVFLLSYAEAHHYFNVTTQNHINMAARMGITTYALNSIKEQPNYGTSEGSLSGDWWLRSPGRFNYEFAIVGADGALYSRPYDSQDVCIRPAIWVNLNSGLVQLVEE